MLEVKYEYRYIVFYVLGDCGCIYDVKILFEYGVVIEIMVKYCMGVFFWVFRIDIIDLCGFYENICF